MFDSTNPFAIPPTAAMVAGYVDGIFVWSPAAWARFAAAVKVRIAVFASTNDGHVLDVERGDATPAQAPGWVQRRRAAGIDPSVYCNTGTWPAVQAAFASAGVAQPHYWVAHYGAGSAIPAGAVAIQYADPAAGSGGQWDISAVADSWPGVDQGGPVTAPNTPDDVAAVGYLAGDNRVKMPDGNSRNVFDCLYDTAQRLIQLQDAATKQGAQVAGLVAAVTELTKANAANQPITQAELMAIVDQAIAQHIQITGTVQVLPASAPTV
jgi:hypothetical protein